MQKSILILAIVLLILTFGCGKTDDGEDAGDISVRLDKMAGDLETASARLDRIEGELANRIGVIEKNTEIIKKLLETLSGEEIAVDAGYASVREESSEVMKEIEGISEDLGNIVESLESLSQEIESVRGEMGNLASANQEVSERAERRNNWEEMGDPEKLAGKLDEFSTAYAPKLEESGRREEFEADMEAYKAEATKEYTAEELVDKYTENLNERISETTDNDRRREWYERRLEGLQNTTGEELDEMLANYRRFDNARQLATITEKFEIPRDEVSQYGLMSFGGRGGGRGRGRGPR